MSDFRQRRALRELHRLFDADAPATMTLEERARAILGHLSDAASGSGSGSGGGNGKRGEQRPASSGAGGGSRETRGPARREAGLHFGARPPAPKPSGKAGGSDKQRHDAGDTADAEAVKRFLAKLLG